MVYNINMKLHQNAKDLTGRGYGRLVAERPVDIVYFPRGGRSIRWKCNCSCGGSIITHGCSLRAGKVNSCGCLQNEAGAKTGAANKRHGKTHSPEHAAWLSMRQRCGNPNHRGYPTYGGRGIAVCQRWNDSFEAFFADMGERPTPKHSLERINNAGNYELGNCRWATKQEQGRNRRSNRIVTAFGRTGPLASFLRTGSARGDYDAVYRRIYKGWDAEQALLWLEARS